MADLTIVPDYDKADQFIQRKPAWCRADQSVHDAATLIAFAEFAEAKNMLEVGSSAGEGAAALLFGSLAFGSHLYGIDLAETVYYNKEKSIGAVVAESFPEFKDRYTIKTGVRSDAVPSLGVKFDLVHIDANHSHPWGVYDFLQVLPCLNHGALIAFHDADYMAAISQAAYYFSRLIPDGVFVRRHFAFQYEGPTDQLFKSIMDCLDINWQTYVPPETIAGLMERLKTVFNVSQSMAIVSKIMHANANYFKFEKLYKDVNNALWQKELQLRKLQAEVGQIQ